MCAPDPPPAPDYSGIAASSDYAANLGYQAAKDDLDFRRGVYEENKPRQQELYDLASNIANQQLNIGYDNRMQANAQWADYRTRYRPAEMAMLMDSYGGQYMTDAERADIQSTIERARSGGGDINRFTAELNDKVQRYSRAAADRQATETEQGYMRNLQQGQSELDQLADARVGSMRAAGADYLRGIQGLRGGVDSEEARQLAYARGQQQYGLQAGDAQINSAYGQQARELMRRGGDPNRLAAAAVQIANAQALARVGNINNLTQTYGALENQILGAGASQRQALDARAVDANAALAEQIGGFQYGVGQARSAMGQQARDAARAAQAGRYNAGIGLRAGAASFGRNMPNTAGQAYGLATQAGNSAVANQNAGFMSGLPYAQFAAGAYGTQLGAAGLGGQQALGMGNIMNQGYSNQLQAFNASNSQPSMFGTLLGLGGSMLGAPQTSIFGGMMGLGR